MNGDNRSKDHLKEKKFAEKSPREKKVKAARFGMLLLALCLFSLPLCADELADALKGVSPDCPQWIIDNQALIEVKYLDFDGKLCRGVIVADFRLAGDIQAAFKTALASRFPVRQVRPVREFGWDDFVSMRADNTSAFNYRTMVFSTKLSNHAYGFAIDINTRENPYFTDGKVYPENGSYEVKAPGTLYADHPVVLEFKKRGWRWGGDWREKDYQHFDKKLAKERAAGNRKFYAWQ